MPKRIGEFKLLINKRINQDHFILELESPDALPEIFPGQFAEVRVDRCKETFLRRPFSFHDVDYAQNTVKFLIQTVGNGTRALSEMLRGEKLNIIYPLGNSFTLPVRGEKVLLTGGGCGTAPLLFLARHINREGIVPDILIGFRNKNRVILHEELSKYGKVHLATEDGSEGFKGFVADHPILGSGKYDRLYCCGPEQMMVRVASIAKSKNIFCEISLENLMACGLGVCLCCIVKTVKGNLCTCTDGPVLNIKDLTW